MLAPPPTLKLDEWTWATATRDGTSITVRPLRADDERREIAFIESLSEQTRYFRMFTPLKYLSPQLLSQFMDVDYDRRMALVATVGAGDQEMFVGVARYGSTDRQEQAELGVTVTDAWQRRGIATILIGALMRFARSHGFHELAGMVLPENHAMLALARSLSFTIEHDPAGHIMKISRRLDDSL
ncbi:GNAT family N-acetyltransferase [Peristeroidobacter agariperforans]|uniref:GNAT family N-acetyltransferase n=1 Tax=Peristeroidobacter agariperforans TaxID=268404 RepID=UPI00130030BC|nr:GNAT family protein [Peristeroidobacter agariperforans]